MSLRTELETYFNNDVYPFVKNTMKENIKLILNDAAFYDDISKNLTDTERNTILNNILSKVQHVNYPPTA